MYKAVEGMNKLKCCKLYWITKQKEPYWLHPSSYPRV